MIATIIDNLGAYFIFTVVAVMYYSIAIEAYHTSKIVPNDHMNKKHIGRHLNILFSTFVTFTVIVGGVWKMLLGARYGLIETINCTEVVVIAIAVWGMLNVSLGHLKEERLGTLFKENE